MGIYVHVMGVHNAVQYKGDCVMMTSQTHSRTHQTRAAQYVDGVWHAVAQRISHDAVLH